MDNKKTAQGDFVDTAKPVEAKTDAKKEKRKTEYFQKTRREDQRRIFGTQKGHLAYVPEGR